MAAFVPPTFGNHGKAASDLFKKKYDDKDFKYIIQTKNRTASGLVFTSGGEFDNKNNVSGNLKINYKKDFFGEFEGSVSTLGPAKAELKLKKLLKGLTVTITGDTAPAFAVAKPGKPAPTFTSSTVKVGAEYAQDFFAGAASVETAVFKPTILVASAVIGFDGLSVGGEVKLNAETITKTPEDYNVAAEYSGVDFTATLKTKEQGSKLTASYIHKVNADVTVGGEFVTPLDGSEAGRAFGIASEYKVDASTTVKVRGSTDKTVALAVDHKLANPRMAVGVASSWEIVGFQAFQPAKFGLSFTFGDQD